MTLFDYVPNFLFPTARMFPFDKPAEDIVRALGKRNWKSPELHVAFDTYGSGFLKFTYVKGVFGTNFQIIFGRTQGTIPRVGWTDCAAVEKIWFDKDILSINPNTFEMTLYTYTGDNWVDDKKEFANGLFMTMDPKKTTTWHDYSGPKCHELCAKMVKVLARVKALPEAGDAYDPHAYFTPITPTPFSDVKHPLKHFYTYCDKKEIEKIKLWREHPEQIPPEQCYLETDSHYLDHAIDEIVPPTGPRQIIPRCPATNCAETIRKDSPANHFGPDGCLVDIRPKYANGIMVDNPVPYETTYQEWFGDRDPNNISYSDLDLLNEKVGNHMVSILEYDGSYEIATAFISRETGLDEVEIVEN